MPWILPLIGPMEPQPGPNSLVITRTVDTVSSTKSGKSFFGSIIRKETKPSNQTEPPKGRFGLTTLHDPPGSAPVADLIFVHGLNGGSQSTWTKGDDSNFWPKIWLPSDDAFADIRIHTFGYHSGLSKESVLNIQDFSRSLLGAIHDAPSIPRDQKVSPAGLLDSTLAWQHWMQSSPIMLSDTLGPPQKVLSAWRSCIGVLQGLQNTDQIHG